MFAFTFLHFGVYSGCPLCFILSNWLWSQKHLHTEKPVSAFLSPVSPYSFPHAGFSVVNDEHCDEVNGETHDPALQFWVRKRCNE